MSCTRFDYDTLWLRVRGKRIKVRLLGIDTPEKYHSRKMERDCISCGVSEYFMKHLGKEVSKHMEELAGRGSIVFLEKYGRGYYGRVLGIIFLPDGTNVNERMVGDGFACVYRYRGGKSPELPMREWIRLNELMKKAKRERRGLWGEAYEVMECLCGR